MKTWFHSRLLLYILLAILVPSASQTVPEKLSALLESLRLTDSNVGYILNITDDQCPCLESTITTANCTFEGSDVCGFSQDLSDNFDWTRHQSSTPTPGTGPQHDHTFEVFAGYYMHIEASFQSDNDIARLNSYILTGPTTPTCVTFWYHMYGSGIGTLNVYVLRDGSRGSPIWTLSGNQGNSWNIANVSLTTVSSNTSYQIVFEASRGTNLGDIAIDDFSVTEGSCSQNQPTVADVCTFDQDVCGFSQDNSDDFDWTRNALSTFTSDTGPEYDHTLGQVGNYMYLEVSSQSANNVARLNSNILTGPITPTCLTFWYHMYGSHIGTLNVYVLRDGSRGSPIWTLSGNQGNSWNIAKVTLNAVSCNTPYQIVFEANRANGIEGDIAIDDFGVTPGACSPDECNLPETHPSITTANCTFEGSDVCGFSQDLSDNFDWTQHQSSTSTSGTGPQHDHTFEVFTGYYMYIEVGFQSANNVARLNSYILTGPTTPTCVTFWYHMFGSGIGTLNVYVLRDGSRGSPIWTLSGNQGNSWNVANVSLTTVSSNTPYQIVFEASRGTNQGDIAIDDFSVTEGSCSQSHPTVADICTFDDDVCGFSQDNSDDFDWTRNALSTLTSNTGPEYDHTLGEAGNYMYLEVSSQSLNDVARLNSTILTGPITPTCVTFWYHMYGSHIGTLNVYVLRNGSRGSPIWTLSGNQGNSWNIAKVTLNAVSCNTPYQIVFEANRANGIEGDIAIDDFSVTPGACPPDECTLPDPYGSITTVNCTFEGSDVCGFSQDLSDNFDWTRLQSSTPTPGTGPQHDHTFEVFAGYYMHIEASFQSDNDVARLNSYILTGPTTPTCVTFWYHMYGSGIGTLNVFVLRDGSRGSPVWTLSGNQGNSWNVANVSLTTVSSNTPYQIVFEASRGTNLGDIAIDDFSVTEGSCSQSQPTVADICTFDDDVCGFSQDNSDDFDWTRNALSTFTSDTGPEYDHTLGQVGNYMYLEVSSQSLNDVGRLNSNILTGPLTPTCVTFWYHMYGSHIGTLNVYVLRDGSRGSPIWTLSGNQGNSWNIATVTLNAVTCNTPYQIVFEANRANGIEGDIAIDDFSVIPGACSPDEDVIQNRDETCQDSQCFEARVRVFRQTLNDLTKRVQSQLSDTAATCPERTGAVFVAACDSPAVAVVDPNGVIQNEFQVASNVTDWTLGPFDNDSFEFDYFGSEPFVLRCLSLPTGMEVVLGNSTDDPLSTTAVGTGSAYFEPTDEVYVAMTFENSSSNGIYAFNRTSFPQIRLVFTYDGTTGRLYVSGNTLYMSDGQTLLRIMESETTWTVVFVWPLEPIAFVGTIVFCEESGAVWTYSQTSQLFRQLKEPTANGDHCGDIALRPCDGLVYVAFKNVQNIEIYNSTESSFVQNLQYTLNNPTSCPSLLLDPRRC